MVKGVIYIQNSDKRVKSVLIAKNTFTNNGAYFGSVGIFIRQQAESGKYPTQVAPTTESELQCGGYLLQENSFTNNGGCTKYSRSMVQIECVESGFTIQNNDDSVYTLTFADDSATLTNYKTNLANYKAVSETTKTDITIGSTTFSVSTYFTKLKSNT